MRVSTRVFVSSVEQERRMGICKTCPEFHLHKVAQAPKCRKCGCFLQAKTWIPGQHCPLKKW